MIFLLDKEWRDGGLNSKISNLAEKVLKKHVNLNMLRHSSATYWAPKRLKRKLWKTMVENYGVRLAIFGIVY